MPFGSAMGQSIAVGSLAGFAGHGTIRKTHMWHAWHACPLSGAIVAACRDPTKWMFLHSTGRTSGCLPLPLSRGLQVCTRRGAEQEGPPEWETSGLPLTGETYRADLPVGPKWGKTYRRMFRFCMICICVCVFLVLNFCLFEELLLLPFRY